MGRTAFLVVMLAASGALAEEKAPTAPTGDRGYAHGILSHGDSGDVMEDFFGGRVEREPLDQPGGANKRDPAIRWEGPAKAR